MKSDYEKYQFSSDLINCNFYIVENYLKSMPYLEYLEILSYLINFLNNTSSDRTYEIKEKLIILYNKDSNFKR